MASVPAPERRSRLDYALAYAALGWAVLPLHCITAKGRCSCGQDCASPGKHPDPRFAPHGVHSASKDPERIKAWWTAAPYANIGVALGAISGIVAVDIDPRNNGDETWAAFVQRNSGVQPDTAIQLTGGGGMHLILRHDPERTLVKPGAGVDIKADGGYIVVEPSSHVSGQHYAWDAEADPLEGQPIADAPAWLTTPAKASITRLGPAPKALGHIDPQRLLDLKAAMAHLDHDDYHVWIGVGMALHSTDAAEAYDLWDEWSQRSSKYDPQVQRSKWLSFGGRPDQLHVESIFAWARDAGWSGESPRIAVPATSVTIKPPAPEPEANPAKDPASSRRCAEAEKLGVHRPPGVLGDLADWITATAPRPQPLWSVSTALALGSVACGRRFVGKPRGNFSPLYFLHLGVSGSGKDYAKQAVYRCLEAAGWDALIGRGSSYASDAAVFSALYHQPQHITITDEIGRALANSKSEGAMHQRSALSALIEVWGSPHGRLYPKHYSMQGLTKEQAEAMAQRVVHKPSLTMIALGQPALVWEALDDGAIRDGFLARLLIVETDIGRSLDTETPDLPIPQPVIDWLRAVRQAGAGQGNLAATLATAGTPADIDPPTVDVPTTPEAMALWRAYQAEVIEDMDALERQGLAEIQSRRVEQAMRIAVILAVSTDPHRPVITADLAQWAITYTRWLGDLTLQAIRQHLHGSTFARQRAAVLAAIAKAGQRGLTERDLAKACRAWQGLEPRQRRAILDAISADGLAALVDLGPGPSGRGRPRKAWVALDNNADIGE